MCRRGSALLLVATVIGACFAAPAVHRTVRQADLPFGGAELLPCWPNCPGLPGPLNAFPESSPAVELPHGGLGCFGGHCVRNAISKYFGPFRYEVQHWWGNLRSRVEDIFRGRRF